MLILVSQAVTHVKPGPNSKLAGRLGASMLWPYVGFLAPLVPPRVWFSVLALACVARRALCAAPPRRRAVEVQRVLSSYFGDRPGRTATSSWKSPTVAADGRVVPVMIESDLPMAAERYVKAVHLLVDNNPDIHLAEFRLTPQIGQAFVSTRIKMRMTSPSGRSSKRRTVRCGGARGRRARPVNGCG